MWVSSHRWKKCDATVIIRWKKCSDRVFFRLKKCIFVAWKIPLCYVKEKNIRYFGKIKPKKSYLCPLKIRDAARHPARRLRGHLSRTGLLGRTGAAVPRRAWQPHDRRGLRRLYGNVNRWWSSKCVCRKSRPRVRRAFRLACWFLCGGDWRRSKGS